MAHDSGSNMGRRCSTNTALLSIADSLSLHAHTIAGAVTQQGGSGPLVLDVTGPEGGAAQSVTLTIDPPVLVFPNLSAVDAAIHTTAPMVRIENGYITGTLSLKTPHLDLWMNNQNVLLLPVDVQLYQQGYQFELTRDRASVFTNAFIENYGPGVDVMVPNYISPHTTADRFFSGASVVRDAGRLQYSAINVDNIIGAFVVLPSGVELPQAVGSSSCGSVNIDFGDDDENDDQDVLKLAPVQLPAR